MKIGEKTTTKKTKDMRRESALYIHIYLHIYIFGISGCPLLLNHSF